MLPYQMRPPKGSQFRSFGRRLEPRWIVGASSCRADYPSAHSRDVMPERAASLRLAGLRGPWDTPGASTGRPTSRLENRSSCSLRSHDCGSFGLPRTSSLAVLRASFGSRLASLASGPSEGPSRTLPRLPRRSVTRSCASSVAFASSSKPPSLPWPIPRSGKPPQLAGRLSWDSSVRPSIDIFPGPGPSALPPPGRLGMPLPGPCRSRGFAPPQRITVPESRRRIAACCRSWGSPRFRACRLATGRAGSRAQRHPRDALRTPRRIPSSAAAPRHRGRCTSCGSTDLRAPPDRFRSRTETPDAPADPMGSGRPIARPTSTHPPGGFHDDRSRREHPPGIDRAPWCGRVRFPPPLRAKDTERDSTRESGPLQGLAPPTSSCQALRIGYRKRRQHGSSWASFPFKVLLPHPCGRNRCRHRRSGRGIELRSVVLSTRAVHAVTRTSRRQAWGAEDTGKPGSSTGHDPCEPCPPEPALAGPGTESLRGFTKPPLAR
jgi:hypothetical protein